FENQGGMVTIEPTDLLKPGQYAFLQNVRKLLGGRIVARPPLGNNLLVSPLPAGITSLTRISDPYLGGSGYAFIEGAAGSLYVNAGSEASGLSGNPLSYLPYRPTGTPRPWCYIGDPSLAVSIPSYIASGYGAVAGMLKVRADGLCRKTGIKEPQAAPTVVSAGGGPNAIVYRDTYRDSTTQAVSNPSPESTPVYNGADNAAVVAKVSAYSPTQYQNYSNGATGGTINGQWSSAYGTFNQLETSVSGGLLQPLQTENMTDSGFGAGSYPVPLTATITGIQFQLNWLGTTGGPQGTLVNCQLAYQGGLLGAQKQPGTISTPTDPGGTFGFGTLIGGDGDTWGASLSPTIVNDPTFGVNFQLLMGTGSFNRLFID